MAAMAHPRIYVSDSRSVSMILCAKRFILQKDVPIEKAKEKDEDCS
jgi:hypothetical protein